MTNWKTFKATREYYEAEGNVHLGAANGDGRTLCGLALEGFEDELPPQKPSKCRTVDCPDCIAVIDQCRGVRVYRDS